MERGDGSFRAVKVGARVVSKKEKLLVLEKERAMVI
jgi:hypothetical protein